MPDWGSIEFKWPFMLWAMTLWPLWLVWRAWRHRRSQRMASSWQTGSPTPIGLLFIEALSLALDEHYFRPMYDWPITTLRLIKYPPHPSQAAFNQLGAGAHTDWGGITLLAQDASGGLEVQNVAGEWLQAPALPESSALHCGC